MLYIIWRLLPAQGSIWLKYLFRLMMASILMLTPVVGYYVWALHVSQTYPPYHVAARGNWVWDAGFATWLQKGYFLPDLFRIGEIVVGCPPPCVGPRGTVAPIDAGRRKQSALAFPLLVIRQCDLLRVWCAGACNQYLEFSHRRSCFGRLVCTGFARSVAALARFRLSLIGRVARNPGHCDKARIRIEPSRVGVRCTRAPELRNGAALARLSRPYDLVITVANSIGDPVAIYYSRRRGWVFPPPWPGVDWAQDIVDEPAAIQLFDRLRSEGAKWFGIVAPQRINFSQTTPRLMKHIESTTELVEEDRDWAIYRISPPSK